MVGGLSLGDGGGSALPKDWWRILAAEAVGTFFLVFPGAGAPILDKLTGGVGLLGIAIANGLGLAIGITATMNISGGALNPAVTVGLWAAKKLKAVLVIPYILAQLVGAVVAALLLKAIFPAAAASATHLGAPALAHVGAGQGVLLEAVMTFLLVMAVFLTAVDERAPKVGGFGIGVIVMVDVLTGGPLTGAAMNPARALGPALVSGYLADQWVWWVGPILGALVAAAVYAGVLANRGPVAAPQAASPAGSRSGQGGRQAGGKRR
jgi:MIP family channel proteins